MGVSESDLELVQRAFAAYSAGDRARLVACIHPAGEIAPLSPDLSGTDGPYLGHAGAEQWLDHLGAARREFSGEVEEVRHAEGALVILGRVQARSPASGFGFTQRVGWVVTVEDELIKSFRGYPDPNAALRAAGL